MTSKELADALNEVSSRLFPHRPKGVLRISDDTLVLGLYLLEVLKPRHQFTAITPDLSDSRYDPE